MEVKSLKITNYSPNLQIVWIEWKTIENKSLPLWNKTISMEDINRLKEVDIKELLVREYEQFLLSKI
jgi:hypothetical protein